MPNKPIPIKEVLARNLNALMDARPKLGSNPKLSKKIGASTSTIHRLRNADTDCTLETLDKLAQAFEVSPWQLLVPGFEPNAHPVLRTLSTQEAEMYERLRSVIIHSDSGLGDLPES